VRRPFVVGPLQRFAIDRNDADLGYPRVVQACAERRHQSAECRIERFRIDQPQHRRERVVRWDAVTQRQEFLEEFELGPAQQRHVGTGCRPAQDRDERDKQNLDKFMPDILGPRIGQVVERRQEQLHGDPRVAGAALI
jgi:hypothetical protein